MTTTQVKFFFFIFIFNGRKKRNLHNTYNLPYETTGNTQTTTTTPPTDNHTYIFNVYIEK